MVFEYRLKAHFRYPGMNLFGIVVSLVVLTRLMYHCKALPMETKLFSGTQEISAGREASQGLETLAHQSITAPPDSAVQDGQRVDDLLRSSSSQADPLAYHIPVSASSIEKVKAAISSRVENFLALPKKWIQRIWRATVNHLKKRLPRWFVGEEELKTIAATRESIVADRIDFRIPSIDLLNSKQENLKIVEEILKQGSSLYNPRYAKYLSESVKQEQTKFLKTVREEINRLEALKFLETGLGKLGEEQEKIITAENELKTASIEDLQKKLSQIQLEQTRFLDFTPLTPIRNYLVHYGSKNPELASKLGRINALTGTIVENYDKLVSRLSDIDQKIELLSNLDQQLLIKQRQFNEVSMIKIKFNGPEIQTGLGKNYPPVVASDEGEKVVRHQQFLEHVSKKVDELLSIEIDQEITQYQRRLTDLKQAALREGSRVDAALSKEWNSRLPHVESENVGDIAG
ncbi:hypothetical protein CROQUDRAFT_107689 [Cronartium quercuum f. sp. fusiforme G11]|uniref:Uncharacterized protein n=1 Tax=Cronartium quercuum f. sp. fusiforme G11 TaxID=708437 RepID=A0A9P6NK35_9BASI|nr:hypothetical protein CROQUDRAFT_107689 [Cronartium quercuum f. sp. fusiforme G11]